MKALQIGVLVTAVLLFAITSASAQNPDSPLASNPVFQQNCAKCHGDTAKGRHMGGPSLISAKVAKTDLDKLHKIIEGGKGRMPKWEGKLTSEEIDTLVEQIKASAPPEK